MGLPFCWNLEKRPSHGPLNQQALLLENMVVQRVSEMKSPIFPQAVCGDPDVLSWSCGGDGRPEKLDQTSPGVRKKSWKILWTEALAAVDDTDYFWAGSNYECGPLGMLVL